MSSLVEEMRANLSDARLRYERALDGYRKLAAQDRIVRDEKNGHMIGKDRDAAIVLGTVRIAKAEIDHWHEYLGWALRDGSKASPTATTEELPAGWARDQLTGRAIGPGEQEDNARRKREIAAATARMLGETDAREDESASQ